MGVFGNILQNVTDKIINKSIESKLHDCKQVGILFDHQQYEPFSNPVIRNAMVQGILENVAFLINVEINNNTMYKNWVPYYDNSVDGELFDGFILKNDKVKIFYGLYNCAEPALLIKGENLHELTLKVMDTLNRICVLDNVSICFEEIPFHNIAWLQKYENNFDLFKERFAPKYEIDGDIEEGKFLMNSIYSICKVNINDLLGDNYSFKKTEQYCEFDNGLIDIKFDLSEEFFKNRTGRFLIQFIKDNSQLLRITFVSDAEPAFLVMLYEDNEKSGKFKITFKNFKDITYSEVMDILYEKGLDIPEDIEEITEDFLYSLVHKMNASLKRG